VIAELRRKLEIIRDVSSDASNADTRHMLKNASKMCKDTNVNITEKKGWSGSGCRWRYRYYFEIKKCYQFSF